MTPRQLRAYLEALPADRVRRLRIERGSAFPGAITIEVELAGPEAAATAPEAPSEDFPGLRDLMNLPRGARGQ